MALRRALMLMAVSVVCGLGCMVAVACGSFTSQPAATADDGASEGAADSSGDRGDPTESGARPDASDGAPDGACKGGKDGRPVVRAGPVCIDATEVSVARYEAFVAASPTTTPDGGPFCAGNDIRPSSTCTGLTSASDTPQTCVDWCDAVAYCEWAGKHLCGAIEGGALKVADNDNAQRDAWFRACAGEDGGRTYPYGDTYDPAACQTEQTNVTAVGAKVGCKTPQGALDMSGNAREWINSCQFDTCLNRGGHAQSGSSAKCGGAQTIFATTASREIGFRCCSD